MVSPGLYFFLSAKVALWFSRAGNRSVSLHVAPSSASTRHCLHIGQPYGRSLSNGSIFGRRPAVFPAGDPPILDVGRLQKPRSTLFLQFNKCLSCTSKRLFCHSHLQLHLKICIQAAPECLFDFLDFHGGVDVRYLHFDHGNNVTDGCTLRNNILEGRV